MMDASFRELISLSEHVINGTATRRDQARLRELLADPEMVERFAAWQTAGLGVAVGLGAAKASKAAALKAMAKAVLPWWKGSLALALVAGGGGLLTVGAFLAVRRPDLPETAPALLRPAAESAPRPLGRTMPEPVQKRAKKTALAVVVTQPESGEVSLRVLDKAGKEVRMLYLGGLEKGDWEFPWDGRDSGGVLVEEGDYVVEIQAHGRVKTNVLKVSRRP